MPVAVGAAVGVAVGAAVAVAVGLAVGTAEGDGLGVGGGGGVPEGLTTYKIRPKSEVPPVVQTTSVRSSRWLRPRLPELPPE